MFNLEEFNEKLFDYKKIDKTDLTTFDAFTKKLPQNSNKSFQKKLAAPSSPKVNRAQAMELSFLMVSPTRNALSLS